MMRPKIIYRIRNSLAHGKREIQRFEMPQIYHYAFAFGKFNENLVVGFSIRCQKYLECRIYQFGAIQNGAFGGCQRVLGRELFHSNFLKHLVHGLY